MRAHQSRRNHDLSSLGPIRPGWRARAVPVAGVAAVLGTAGLGVFLAFSGDSSDRSGAAEPAAIRPITAIPEISTSAGSGFLEISWVRQVPAPSRRAGWTRDDQDPLTDGSLTDGSPIEGSPTEGLHAEGRRSGGPHGDEPAVDGSGVNGSRVDGSRVGGSRVGGSRVDGGTSRDGEPRARVAVQTPRTAPRPPAVAPASPAPAPAGVRPDPCATFNDLRRDYCYQVLDRLTR